MHSDRFSFACNFAHECPEYAKVGQPDTLTDAGGECMPSSSHVSASANSYSTGTKLSRFLSPRLGCQYSQTHISAVIHSTKH